MENKMMNSRSVIIDPIYKKNMEQNYDKHKQRLN